ncbi:hypothetical protein D3C86_1654540 [compost metagenome]
MAGIVVVLLHQPLAVAQDGGLRLHYHVRRQAALAAPDAHRAARRVKAHAHLLRRLNRIIQPRAVRIQVEVIARRGAAGQHQLGHRRLRGHPDHLRRQVRPQHVEVGQPREQLGILRGRHGARQALVHVMVRIHQPRHDHVATHVDDLGAAFVGHAPPGFRQLGGGTDPFDGGTAGDQRAVRDFAALRVHGH